jgi:hypothetical protein
MNLEDMMLPPNGKQESLRPYVGQRNPSDSLLRNYKKPLAREHQLDQNHGIEYTILNYLMQKFPQHKADLFQLFRQKQGRQMDQTLNKSLFNRAQDSNSMRMDEMKYLPSGDWNKMQGPMFPLPRRM